MCIRDRYEEYQKQTASYNKGGNQHLKAKSKEAIGGAEGYRIDRTEKQNAVDFWKAQLEYIEKGFVWGENQKMFHNIGEVIKGVEEKMPNTASYMQEYRLNAIGVRRNVVGRLSDIMEEFATNKGIPVRDIAEWSKGTLNSMLLGGPHNVVFSATQLIQVINATPELKILIERNGNTVTEAVLAPLKSLNLTSPLNKEALKWANENHVARSAVFGDTVNLGSSKAARAAHAAGDIWNITPKKTDAIGRSYVFLNAVNLLTDLGKSKEIAFLEAADLTQRAMVDYRNPETPMMLSSGGLVGSTSMFLMKYPANYWNQLFSHMSNKDFTSFGLLITGLGLTAGAMGMAGIETYEFLRKVWNDSHFKIGEEGKIPLLGQGKQGRRLPSYNELVFKSGVPQWVAMGPLSTVTGIDFSSKTGMKDTVGNSFTDVLLPGSGFGVKAASGIAGAMVDPSSTAAWQTALHSTLPTSMKGFTEEAFYTDKPDSSGRALFRNPNTDDGEYRRTPFDRAVRMIGGRSTQEAYAKAKAFSDNTESKEKSEYRTEVVNRYIKESLTTNNPLKKGKLAEDAIKIYVKLGGNPEQFIQAVEAQSMNAKTTPDQRKLMQTNPQKLKQAREYGYGRQETTK